MVEKQRSIASKYFGNERFNGELGKNSSCAKKRIVLCLGGDQSLCQAMEY